MTRPLDPMKPTHHFLDTNYLPVMGELERVLPATPLVKQNRATGRLLIGCCSLNKFTENPKIHPNRRLRSLDPSVAETPPPTKATTTATYFAPNKCFVFSLIEKFNYSIED